MDTQQIILVIAKSLSDFNHELISRGYILHPQAVYNMSENRLTIGNKTWQYISEPNKLRGFHGVDVEFWGLAFTIEAKKLKQFEELAQIARMK